MPIGTNNNPATVEGLINLPPPAYAMNTAAAFSTNGQIYLANDADLYLTNFPNGTNWGSPRAQRHQHDSVLSGWRSNSPYLTQIPYDFYLMTNRNIHTAFFPPTG